MHKPMNDALRTLLEAPRTGTTPPPGWKPKGLPRGNPRNAAATLKDKANARAAEMAPVIKGLRAEGFTTVRALCAELAARGVPTARGGQWNASEVQRLLVRIEALPRQASSCQKQR